MRRLIVLCLAFVCLLVPVSAVDGDTPAAPDTSEISEVVESVEDTSLVDSPDDVQSPVPDVEDVLEPEEIDPQGPQEVIVVDPSEVAEYPVISYSAPTIVEVIGDDAPTASPFYGSGWVTGQDSNLGIITLYFPRNYCSDTWGVDSNGYLFNVTSSSVGGYYSGAYNNSVSAPSFSYPRYRSSQSSYDYVDIHLVPLNSNMDIYTTNRPRKTMDDLLPYVTVLLIGGVLVCCMRRSSS
nr:MAG TPA: hypothetical protein [Inoviridae sp.]